MNSRWQGGLRVLGKPGVAGLGLLVFCLTLFTFWHRPLVAESARLEAMLARTQLAATSADPAQAGAADLVRALAELQRDLPAEAQLGAAVKDIHAIALKQGVGLRRGGYERVWETAGRFGRQRMVFQSDAPYGAVRAFLREALQQQPALALEDATFARRAGTGTLETTLTLTLLVARTEAQEAK